MKFIPNGIFVFLATGLTALTGCGKVSQSAPSDPITSYAMQRFCPETNPDDKNCFEAKWLVGPINGKNNSLEIPVDSLNRAAHLRDSSLKVFAQMKCCGTVKEGVAHWEGDKLIVENLTLWAGDWLIVIETETAGAKTQSVGSVLIR